MRYIPQPVADLPGVDRELDRIRVAQQEIEPTLIIVQTSYAAPARPQEGMIARADGALWNPGAGAGLYEYLAAAWVKL